MISGGPKMNEFQEGQKRIDTNERCTMGRCQDLTFLMRGGFVVKIVFKYWAKYACFLVLAINSSIFLPFLESITDTLIDILPDLRGRSLRDKAAGSFGGPWECLCSSSACMFFPVSYLSTCSMNCVPAHVEETVAMEDEGAEFSCGY